MINVIKHGKYTRIYTCKGCNCTFTYIDRGNCIRNEFQDIQYVRDDSCKFLYKVISCPECGNRITFNEQNEKETLMNDEKNIQL